MKFTAREDVAVPIEAAFGEISDFEGFERAAMRRGAEVTRGDDLARPGPGMKWKVVFEFRSRPRQADLELIGFDAPNGLSLNALSSGIEMQSDFELVALSRNQTRINATTEFLAHSIAARLLLQSFKLARTGLTNRYRNQIADFARGIEARHG